jgi:ribonuclease Y
LHKDIVRTLGKLKYRSSYGQNVLQHCQEVAELAGILAAQLDLDAVLARRAGILHKIGLVITKANESDYSKVGHEFIKKYGEHPQVLNAILAFSNKAEANSPIPIILRIADEISRKRPGARRDVIENYVKRLNSLEDIADSFEGVKNAYAIQAGKEIRIIIDHSKADDAMSHQLATDIAKKIKSAVDPNNSVKVNVIREFRSVDYA